MTDSLRNLQGIREAVDGLTPEVLQSILYELTSQRRISMAIRRIELSPQDLTMLTNNEIKEKSKREWQGLGNQGIEITEKAIRLYLAAIGYLKPFSPR